MDSTATSPSLSIHSATSSRTDRLRAARTNFLSPLSRFYRRWRHEPHPLHRAVYYQQYRRYYRTAEGYMLIGNAALQLAPDDAYLSCR